MTGWHRIAFVAALVACAVVLVLIASDTAHAPGCDPYDASDPTCAVPYELEEP